MVLDCPFTRRRRKEARPAELIAAAFDVFVEKGYAAARLDEVAKRAGVSKGTLYLYFDSKETLFKAVIREGLTPLLDTGELLVADTTKSAYEMLTGLVDGWWGMVATTKLSAIPKLIIADAQNFPDIAEFYNREVILRGRGVMRRVIERGMDSGEFRRVDVEPAIDILMAPMLMHVIMRHSINLCCADSPQDPARYLAAYKDLVLAALCTSPPKEQR